MYTPNYGRNEQEEDQQPAGGKVIIATFSFCFISDFYLQ